jgi:hypothetical protein
MSRLEYVDVFRRIPPKCMFRARLAHGRCTQAEHGDIAAEARCLQNACSDQGRVCPCASRSLEAVGTLIAGLSRRRSRVRVPSLPLSPSTHVVDQPINRDELVRPQQHARKQRPCLSPRDGNARSPSRTSSGPRSRNSSILLLLAPHSGRREWKNARHDTRPGRR